jgi:hypothetical protein
MKKIPLFLIVFGIALGLIFSCKTPKTTTTTDSLKSVDIYQKDRGDIRYVFYNVENLFDMIDDTLKNDDDFLPWGMNGWKSERYHLKLRQIYKVLVNIGGWELPEMIAFCEIENRFVLEELLNKTPLGKGNYGIIHEESPDARGIDVGFMYRRDAFIPITHEAIEITFPGGETYKTRDLLYIQGVANLKDTLNLFICHFPSRRGGAQASEPRRIFVAEQVRKKVDELKAVNPNANIVIVGDYNDEPMDKSIYETLNAKGDWDNLKEGELYNFMYPMKVKQGLGTYKYQGFWNMLDQFIVSQAMLNPTNNVYLKNTSGQIYTQDWLLTDDDDAPGKKPYRTYLGSRYQGGYSDHLPVFLDMYFKK